MYSYQNNAKVYQLKAYRNLFGLQVVADKDHDEELARVMAVYRDTDLQQYKLESQLSLLPEMVQVMGYNTSRFNVVDLLDFFQSRGNVH